MPRPGACRPGVPAWSRAPTLPNGDHRLNATATRPSRELETFLDGELSAEDALASIRAHLEACPDCFQAFDFQAELKAVIAAQVPRDEMPAGLLARIEQCFQTDLDGDGHIG